MASTRQHDFDQPSAPSGAATPERQADIQEAGEAGPPTVQASSDTVLISSSPRALSPANSPIAATPEIDHVATPSASSPHHQIPTAQIPDHHSTATPENTSRPPPVLSRQSTSNESKKCWICFGDSTEDGPDASPWRTPCPCALTAHESCLLDWIADLEAPTGSSSQASRKRKSRIQCPQCKTDIRVARPWSPVVATVRAMERITGTLVLPGVTGVLLGGVYSACFVHGAISVLMVLGQEDWTRLIGATSDGRPTKTGLRVTLGLPMVPVVLILSRTKLADGMLPLLPFILFAPQLGSQHQWHRLASSSSTGSPFGTVWEPARLWPPSAAAAFASLPYLRALYNAAYNRLFAERQRRWLKAVQREPRPGEENAQMADEDADVDENEIELEINAQIQVLDEDGEEQPAEVVDQPAAAENQAPADAQQEARPAQQQQNGLVLSASKIADTVLGALCFPAIAALMGEAIRLGLPAKWTSVTLARRPGLLQQKWGRSLVGGCLFVVVKDALLLYSHYRLAQDHHKRRVQDYKGRPTRSRGRAA